METKNETHTAYWTLRLTYGLVPIVAGLDKFTNLLTDWTQYLSPVMRDALPVSPHAFMMGVGVIEIAAGALVLSKLTRLGAYVVAAWLVAIALNLLTTGHYDVAVRDAVMAIGAFTLAKLEEARVQMLARAPGRPVIATAH
ncbi:MAG: DoxX family membrane protein [Vicinamibacterales bacterium]